ncbi:MAG: bifunctional DNA primase/polymerase [Rhodospirillaceae bacterium]
MTKLEAALRYAGEGLWVFPVHSVVAGKCTCGKASCKPAGKHPRTRSGHKAATTDSEEIERWWTDWPEANIGIATEPSRLVVLDVDVREGRRGEESLERLQRLHEPLPATRTVKTGSGGSHRYFRSNGTQVRSGTLSGFPDIDIKARGGYVVAPPSDHITGGCYSLATPADYPIADFPAWLAALRSADSRATPASSPPRSSAPPGPDTIPPGSRNKTLTSMAGGMWQQGLSQAAILAALETENRDRCQPPLEPDEVDGIVKSITTRYSEGPSYRGGIFLPRELQDRLRPYADQHRVMQYLIERADWTPAAFGQVEISFRELGNALATEWNRVRAPLQPSAVKRALEALVEKGLIEVLGTRPRTRIAVLNFQQFRGIPVGVYRWPSWDLEQHGTGISP